MLLSLSPSLCFSLSFSHSPSLYPPPRIQTRQSINHSTHTINHSTCTQRSKTLSYAAMSNDYRSHLSKHVTGEISISVSLRPLVGFPSAATNSPGLDLKVSECQERYVMKALYDMLTDLLCRLGQI